MGLGWVRTLGTVSSILTLVVILVGLIVIALAYFRKGKTRATLLGAIGFLILFLFSCCTLGWGFADAPVTSELPMRSVLTYHTVKSIVLFLGGLINLVGFGLVIAAVAGAGRKE